MTIGSGRLAGPICALFALWLVSITQADAAPLASALGPEVALAEPQDGFVGSLSVTPENGPAGTPLTVTAEKLPPNQEFQLIWRTVKGIWKVANAEYHGREYQPVAYQIAKVKSDSTGRLTAKFVTPEDFGFGHDIVLQQPDRMFTQVGFSIDMTVKITPESGPVGTPITVEVKSIGWRSLFNSWDLLYDNHFTGWMSAVTTGGSATFTIPATGRVGLHVLEVLHGELTFPYRNMQQNPEPDRPRWAIPFRVTAGAPVLPPSPGEQAQKAVRNLPPPGALAATPAFSGIQEPVVVRGQGFEPGKTYQLNWTHVVGNRMTGAGWEEGSHVVAQATADSSDERSSASRCRTIWRRTAVGRQRWRRQTDRHLLDRHRAAARCRPRPGRHDVPIHSRAWAGPRPPTSIISIHDNDYIGYACAFNSQGDVG